MAVPPGGKTFLVESYVPKLDEATAALLSSRLRAAVAELHREGLALRWLRSLAVVEEETYMWIAGAADAHDVALAHLRAGVGFDHIAEVVPDEASDL